MTTLAGGDRLSLPPRIVQVWQLTGIAAANPTNATSES